MIEFKVYGLPTAKGRPRFNKIGFAYTDKKTIEAERDFKCQALQYKPTKPLEGPIKLTVAFYKPKPKSKPKKVWACITRPDLDNYLKLVKDSMNKIFWQDDSQVTDIVAKKRYGEPARTEIKLEVLENEQQN